VVNAHELADHICAVLRQNGFQSYLVGGCVRDLILQRVPADYDVATDATPQQVSAIFPDALGVGAQFGVMLVPDPRRDPDSPALTVEVATFRSDVGYTDGRHPDRVVYTTSAEEDARRRDFTINALMMDPEKGEILDFVGGQQDLRTGVVRAIGDPVIRFREDKLRMLRAVRFAARLGYVISPPTAVAISGMAGYIQDVSAERIRDELTKILTEGAARRGFELLDATGLLSVPLVLPEIAAMKGVEQPPQYHPEGDVWVHTMIMLAELPSGCSPTLAWGVLLHDVGKPPTFKPPTGPSDRIRFDGHAEIGAVMAEAICRRLRFSNDDTAQIVALVANHMKFKDAAAMRPATMKRFVRLDRFPEHLELHRVDCLSSHRMLQNYDLVRRFIAETPPEEVRPPRLLTGNDLKEMGFRAGPVFKEILAATEDAQLDGRWKTREEALAWVKSNFVPESEAMGNQD
jgi:poly(A) polymerase